MKYSQAFTGAIAEVAIYPFALTPAQIANHYAPAHRDGRRRQRLPPLRGTLALAIGLAD